MNSEIYGLLLVGGESRRMGRDKALISYHGEQTQLERTAALLQNVCSRVYISQRKTQPYPTPINTTALYDALDDIHGPLCGILSAMHAHPKADWLVVACDLPKLQLATLEKLVTQYRSRGDNAPLAYRSSHDGLPEPLCAIYPGSLANSLHAKALELKKFCPRKLLIQLDVAMIEQDDPESLDNINTPDEFEAVAEN